MTMQRACSNHQGQNTEPWSIYELHEYMTAGENCNSAPICIVMGLVYLMRNPGLKKPQWSVMISVLTRDQLQLKYS